MPTLAEFDASVDAPTQTNSVASPAIPQQVQPSAAQLLPMSAAATNSLSKKNVVQTAEPPKVAGTPFQERNTLKDAAGNPIELDIASGAPPEIYFPAALNRLQKDQVKYYQSKYGEKNVRLSDTGEPIVRIIDSKTKKPKDVLANPRGMDLNDFLDLAAQAPEIAGGIAATIGSRGTGLIPFAKTLVRMAAGTEGAGAAKDIATRASEGKPIDPSEIAGTRALDAIGDVGGGAVMGAGGKLLSKVITPFGRPNELTIDARSAQKFLQQELPGREFPLTPGEMSGNPLLLKTEARATQMPGSSGPLHDIIDQRNKDLAELQNVARGLPPNPTEAQVSALPTEETVGQKATGVVGSKNLALESEVQQGKDAVLEQAGKEVSNAMPVPAWNEPVNTTLLGQFKREKVKGLWDEFQAKAKADYAAVENHPLSQRKNISADPLAADAKALMDKFPSKETTSTKTTTTFTVDDLGLVPHELTSDEKGRKILTEFIPAGIRPKLNALVGLKGSNMRLDELQAIRTEVRNAINQAQALPGVKTHYLDQMEKMLTDRIKTGLDEIGDPELKRLWTTANDNYAKGIERFEKSGISPMLIKEGQPGFIGNTAIVEKAIKNPDLYFSYQQFFGANSPEFQGMKRAIADTVVETDNLTGTVDWPKLRTNLNALLKENPQVARDVFGSKLTEMFQTAEVGKLAGQKIDAEELSKLINSKNLSYKKLLDLVSSEGNRAQVYQNRIRAAIKGGTLESSSIRPSEFVRYLSDAGKVDLKDVQGIMSLLSDQPALIEDIRSLTAQKILNEASPSARAADNPAITRNLPRALGASKLQNALGDQKQREIYRSILGADTVKLMEEVSKFLAPGEIQQASFSTSGALSAGSQIAGMVDRGELKYVERAIGSFIKAALYTNPRVRAWAGNTLLTPQQSSSFARNFIASTPFIEAVLHQYGKDQGARAIQGMKYSINRFDRENKSTLPGKGKSAAEFLNQP